MNCAYNSIWFPRNLQNYQAISSQIQCLGHIVVSKIIFTLWAKKLSSIDSILMHHCLAADCARHYWWLIGALCCYYNYSQSTLASASLAKLSKNCLLLVRQCVWIQPSHCSISWIRQSLLWFGQLPQSAKSCLIYYAIGFHQHQFCLQVLFIWPVRSTEQFTPLRCSDYFPQATGKLGVPYHLLEKSPKWVP